MKFGLFKLIIAKLITIKTIRTQRKTYGIEDQIYTGNEKIYINANYKLNAQLNKRYVKTVRSTSPGVEVIDIDSILSELTLTSPFANIKAAKQINRNSLAVISNSRKLTIFTFDPVIGDSLAISREFDILADADYHCLDIQSIPSWSLVLALCQRMTIRTDDDYSLFLGDILTGDSQLKKMSLSLADALQMRVRMELINQNFFTDRIYFGIYRENAEGETVTGGNLPVVVIKRETDGNGDVSFVVSQVEALWILPEEGSSPPSIIYGLFQSKISTSFFGPTWTYCLTRSNEDDLFVTTYKVKVLKNENVVITFDELYRKSRRYVYISSGTGTRLFYNSDTFIGGFDNSTVYQSYGNEAILDSLQGTSTYLLPAREWYIEGYDEINSFELERTPDQFQMKKVPYVENRFEWIANFRDNQFSIDHSISSFSDRYEGKIVFGEYFNFFIQADKITIKGPISPDFVLTIADIISGQVQVEYELNTGEKIEEVIEVHDPVSNPYEILDPDYQLLESIEWHSGKNLGLMKVRSDKQKSAMNLITVASSDPRFEFRRIRFFEESTTYAIRNSRSYLLNCSLLSVSEVLDQEESELDNPDITPEEIEEEINNANEQSEFVSLLNCGFLKMEINLHEDGVANITYKNSSVDNFTYPELRAEFPFSQPNLSSILFTLDGIIQDVELKCFTKKHDICNFWSETDEKFYSYKLEFPSVMNNVSILQLNNFDIRTINHENYYYNKTSIGSLAVDEVDGIRTPMYYGPGSTSQHNYFCQNVFYGNTGFSMLSQCPADPSPSLIVDSILKEVKTRIGDIEVFCNTEHFYAAYSSITHILVIGDKINYESSLSSNQIYVLEIGYASIHRLDCVEDYLLVVLGFSTDIPAFQLITSFNLRALANTPASILGKQNIIKDQVKFSTFFEIVSVSKTWMNLSPMTKKKDDQQEIIIVQTKRPNNNTHSIFGLFNLEIGETTSYIIENKTELDFSQNTPFNIPLEINGQTVNSEIKIIPFKRSSGELQQILAKSVQRDSTRFNICDQLVFNNAYSVYLKTFDLDHAIGEMRIKYDYPLIKQKKYKGNSHLMMITKDVYLEYWMTGLFGSGKQVVLLTDIRVQNKPFEFKMEFGSCAHLTKQWKYAYSVEDESHILVLMMRDGYNMHLQRGFIVYDKQAQEVVSYKSLRTKIDFDDETNFPDIDDHSLFVKREENDEIMLDLLYFYFDPKSHNSDLHLKKVCASCKNEFEHPSLKLEDQNFIAYTFFASEQDRTQVHVLLQPTISKLVLKSINLEGGLQLISEFEFKLDTQFNFTSLTCHGTTLTKGGIKYIGKCLGEHKGFINLNFMVPESKPLSPVQTRKLISSELSETAREVHRFLSDNYMIRAVRGKIEGEDEKYLVKTEIWNLTKEADFLYPQSSINFYTQEDNYDKQRGWYFGRGELNYDYIRASFQGDTIFLQMNNETYSIQSINENPICDAYFVSTGHQSDTQQFIFVSNGEETKAFWINSLFSGGNGRGFGENYPLISVAFMMALSFFIVYAGKLLCCLIVRVQGEAESTNSEGF